MCGVVVASLASAALLAGVPLILTSWASSMALITTNTRADPAVPWRVAGGHLVTGGLGLLLVQVAGHIDLAGLASAGAADPAGAARAAGLVFCGVAGGVGAMMASRVLHPPAAANAVILLVSPAVTPASGAQLLVLGAVTLATTAWLLRRVQSG